MWDLTVHVQVHEMLLGSSRQLHGDLRECPACDGYDKFNVQSSNKMPTEELTASSQFSRNGNWSSEGFREFSRPQPVNSNNRVS